MLKLSRVKVTSVFPGVIDAKLTVLDGTSWSLSALRHPALHFLRSGTRSEV